MFFAGLSVASIFATGKRTEETAANDDQSNWISKETRGATKMYLPGVIKNPKPNKKLGIKSLSCLFAGTWEIKGGEEDGKEVVEREKTCKKCDGYILTTIHFFV